MLTVVYIKRAQLDARRGTNNEKTITNNFYTIYHMVLLALGSAAECARQQKYLGYKRTTNNEKKFVY